MPRKQLSAYGLKIASISLFNGESSILVRIAIVFIYLFKQVPHRSIALRVPSFGWGIRNLNVEY